MECNGLNLEVFVTILGTCHPLFPITHAATTKNNLLDSKISAIQKKVTHTSFYKITKYVFDLSLLLKIRPWTNLVFYI